MHVEIPTCKQTEQTRRCYDKVNWVISVAMFMLRVHLFKLCDCFINAQLQQMLKYTIQKYFSKVPSLR